MRIRRQWRLRTMLLGIAALAILMAVVTEPRRRLAAQERAIAALEKLDACLINLRPFSCVPDSTRRPVVAICINDDNVADVDLVPLVCLTELETLDLSFTKVSDLGLANLEGLTNLRELNLVETQITDTGLVHLRWMVNLKSLNIAGTKVAGPGLAYLRGLTHLKSLSLDSTPVTDSDVIYLKDLTQLTTLLLADTNVTNAGMKELELALTKTHVRWAGK